MRAKILSEKERKHLADVIGELEHKTVGEIRLMIVGRSSVSGHVLNTLWALLMAMAFLTIWFERHYVIYFERWWLWPCLIAALYAIANLLSRFDFIQRSFTPTSDLHQQVLARAEVEFHREGLGKTEAQTGVLVFVSLMERIAVVLADRGISEKVPVHTWDKVVAKVIAGAKTGRWAEKFEDALRECGAQLATHFPAQGRNTNELPNTVILKE